MVDKVDIYAYDDLNRRLKEANREIEELRYQLNKYQAKNPRGAGRKSRMTDQDKKMIIELRLSGMSYHKIAEQLDLPVGSVFNYIKLNMNSIKVIEISEPTEPETAASLEPECNESGSGMIVEKMLYRNLMRNLVRK